MRVSTGVRPETKWAHRARAAAGCGLLVGALAADAGASEWFVSGGSSGNGSALAPFGSIQAGLAAAAAGDTVTVLPGVYWETLHSVRDGAPGLPVTLRSAGGLGTVTVIATGTLLHVEHAYLVVEDIVFDGQYGAYDLIDVGSAGDFFTLRHSEVRRTSKDCIDIKGAWKILVEGSSIHHCLNASDGRTDAHGIVASPVHGLTIRDTDIHTFSGDAVQLGSGRVAPGWDDVTIERCRFWLEPLPSEENGFPAGTVPGENAVDTKTWPDGPRSRLSIRDTTAWGFRGGLINNMAAFNLKEKVQVTADRVTVHDSEIGFRVRGSLAGTPYGSHVTITNTVVHSSVKAVRYEDALENFHLWHSTFGAGVAMPFQAASAAGVVLDVLNLLVLGDALPPEAPADLGNLAVSDASFADVTGHDYHLRSDSPAVDAGLAPVLAGVDRDGFARPLGAACDVGAYEFRPEVSATSLAVDDVAAVFGGTADMRAVLTAAGEPVAGGAVSFTLNGVRMGSALSDASGAAVLAGARLALQPAGRFEGGLVASFAGSTALAGSYGAGDVDIAQAAPSVSLAASPAGTTGGSMPVILTAQVAVAGALATGVVQFLDEDLVLGRAPLNGTFARLTVTTLAPGDHLLTASYLGDGNVQSGTSVSLAYRITLAGIDLVETALSDPPASIAPGSGFAVTDTAGNARTWAAGGFVVRYYLSADGDRSNSDVTLSGSRSVAGLDGMGLSTGTVWVRVPTATPLGAYWLLACADAGQAVDEVVETNNCRAAARTLLVALPDFVEVAVSAPPAVVPGSAVTVRDTVQNVGAAPGAAAGTRYYLSSDAFRGGGDVLLSGTRSVPALTPGTRSAGQRSVTVPSTVVPGTYRLLACADGTLAVKEANESNNCLASAGHVLVGYPDLIVAMVGSTPATAGPGSRFTVTDTTRNAGDVGAAASSYTRYYLSLDAVRDGADVLIGSRGVAALGPGGSAGGSATAIVPVTVAPGTYVLLACADATMRVKESAENNNCRQAGPVQIVVP